MDPHEFVKRKKLQQFIETNDKKRAIVNYPDIYITSPLFVRACESIDGDKFIARVERGHRFLNDLKTGKVTFESKK